MSGYKSINFSHSQSEQWIDTLSKNGIVVTFECSDDRCDEDSGVTERPFTIISAARRMNAIKYTKRRTGEEGIVFLSNSPEDSDCIDAVISFLRQM